MGRLGRFIAASGCTNLADGVAVVAWGWLASLLTRDAFLIALVPFALQLPWFLFALPAGVVIDRVDRRRVILTADVVRALAFGVVAVSVAAAQPLAEAQGASVSDPVLFWTMLAAAAVVGTAEVFRDNAAQTMLPALVPDKARLEGANGRLWSVEMLGNALVGPALGAVLIGWMLALPFGLNAIGYLAAVVIVSQLTGRFRAESTGAPRHFRCEIGEGLAFLRSVPLLRHLAVITGSWNLIFQLAMVVMVLHVQENLGLSATAYGLVMAGGAAGGIVGSLSGEWMVRRFGPARVAQTTLLIPGLALIGMGLAPNGWVFAGFFAVAECAGLAWNVVSVSYRQRLIPDRLYGRVNSLYRLLAWGGLPLGSLLSGLIVRGAETVVPRGPALAVPFLLAGALSVFLAALAWRPLGRGFGARD